MVKSTTALNEIISEFLNEHLLQHTLHQHILNSKHYYITVSAEAVEITTLGHPTKVLHLDNPNFFDELLSSLKTAIQ